MTPERESAVADRLAQIRERHARAIEWRALYPEIEDIPWLLKQLELARDLAAQRGIMLDEAVERNRIAVEGLKGGATRIFELEAKLAEVRKDSARLDWIFANENAEIVLWGTDRSGMNPKKNELKDRAAIDQAMEPKP